MRTEALTSTTTDQWRHDLAAVDDCLCEDSPARPCADMPLTTALLNVGAIAISFATPGHRRGRSCRQF